jgi:thiol-disulfide isomerase/thioredoxin
MTIRPSRLQALHDDVERALQAIDFGLDDIAHDAWLTPRALLDASDAEGPLLLRVAGELPDAPERWTPPPNEPWWLRSEGGPKLELLPMRGGPKRQVEAKGLRLIPVDELCCDAPKCDRERQVGEIWLDLDELPGSLLVGEVFGSDDDVAGLARLGRALAERLDVPFEGPDGDGPLAEGQPLTARALSRWSMRREVERFVVRDHAQTGPRESVPREVAILLAMVLTFAGTWFGTWQAYQSAAWTRVAIFGATALVMTFFVITMIQIVRHSLGYRAQCEALAWIARDRLVAAPWHNRDGAIDLGTAGQYGAAIPLTEIDRLELVAQGDGWSLRCDGDHGAIEIGVLEDEAQAQLWLAALSKVADVASHGDGRPRLAAPTAALALLVALLAGCHPTEAPASVPPSPSAQVPGEQGSTPQPPIAPETRPADVSDKPEAPKLTIVEDDVPGAMARAKAANKAVFVEVWAPWCHTCLSMKNFVLPDPAILPLRERVVFAAVDSDRPGNAAFMARYAVNVWPTLFVLEATTGEVLGLWQGAASVEELRSFVMDAVDEAAVKIDAKGPLAAMRQAKRAHAKAEWPAAAQGYQLALDRGGASWKRRSEAMLGLVFAEYRQTHWERCAQLGAEHIAEVEGAAVPADLAWVVLACADEVKAQVLAKRARGAAIERLKRHTETPPASASVDDKSDALSIYAAALKKAGDEAGSQAARRAQVALLESASAASPGPEEAATFDYARMGAYLALGRGNDAVTFLTQRCAQLPDSYEPPARLGQALLSLGRHGAALGPIQTAIDKSYGPRQLRYLGMLAEAKAKLADRAGRIEALEGLVKAFEALSDEQRGAPSVRKQAEKAASTLRSLGRPTPLRP